MLAGSASEIRPHLSANFSGLEFHFQLSEVDSTPKGTLVLADFWSLPYTMAASDIPGAGGS